MNQAKNGNSHLTDEQVTALKACRKAISSQLNGRIKNSKGSIIPCDTYNYERGGVTMNEELRYLHLLTLKGVKNGELGTIENVFNIISRLSVDFPHVQSIQDYKTLFQELLAEYHPDCDISSISEEVSDKTVKIL